MKDEYSKYWITAREKIYGFSEYDRNLCTIVVNIIPRGGLLEVGIGTGYPFADFFQKAGYIIYGTDLSINLLKKLKQINTSIHCNVGDAEQLSYADNKFDCTYCFHSTWYFPDLNKAIDEMLRVTRKGGAVIFDIQNCNNEEIKKPYYKRLFPGSPREIFIRFLKNICKTILQRGQVSWINFTHEVPAYPQSIYKHLKKKGISNLQIMVKNKDESIEPKNNLGLFKEFGRLIFIIRK